MRSSKLLACSLLAGCVLLCACGGPTGQRPAWELSAATDPYERDIPLPRGFKLAERSSEDWFSGSIRYVRHRYVGRADKYSVRKFYREQMPLVRWTTLTDSQLHGRYSLRFQRGSESCTIEIVDSGSWMFPRVAVDVVIGPMAQAKQ